MPDGGITDVGIAWYRARNYRRLKAMFADGEVLPDTYEEWLRTAQRLVLKLTADGFNVVKAHIEPDTFPEWCKAHGVAMNTKGRTAFATDCAQKAMKGSTHD